MPNVKLLTARSSGSSCAYDVVVCICSQFLAIACIGHRIGVGLKELSTTVCAFLRKSIAIFIAASSVGF